MQGNNDVNQDDFSAVLSPEVRDEREVANAIASLDPTVQGEHSTESNVNVIEEMGVDNGSEEMLTTSVTVSSIKSPVIKR